jgi:hypothetical protein
MHFPGAQFPYKIKYRINRHKARKYLSDPPIIIGGCGRSGTTLLLSIISSHPKVFAISEETGAFCPTSYSQSHGKYDFDINSPINTDYFYYKYFNTSFRHKSYRRWCEKTPKNILFFEKILEYFNGNVKLIQIIRDGRDVILSKHPSNPSTYWVSVDRWINDTYAGLKYIDDPRVLTVCYEKLVLNSEMQIQRICNYLDLDYCKEIRHWYQYATVRQNAAWEAEVQPIFRDSIGRWKDPHNMDRVSLLLNNTKAADILYKLDYL